MRSPDFFGPIDADRYPLSPRLAPFKAILGAVAFGVVAD
jgi:hypothetical protein